MKVRSLILVALSLGMLAGCSTTHEKKYSTVMAGMSRYVLRYNFGEPLRIEPGTKGGETWYYRFSSWQTQPTSASGTRDDFGEKTSYISAGMDFSKQVLELPVHVSADGFVVPPLPKGRVVNN